MFQDGSNETISSASLTHRWVDLAAPIEYAPCKQTYTLISTGLPTTSPEACVSLPQSGVTYAMKDYNSRPLRDDSPFLHLSPLQFTKLMLTRSYTKYIRTYFNAQYFGSYNTKYPTHLHTRALNCIRAITGSMRFPWNSFKYFSPSFQSSFHLSFTLLLRYRSPRNI